MSLTGIKLITFDATNTLIKFKMAPWQYYAKIARTYGYSGNENDVRNSMKVNLSVMLKKHPNFGKNTISWDEWWRQVVTLTLQDHLPASTDIKSLQDTLICDFETSKCWDVAAGTKTLLETIKSKQIILGVISNTDPRLHTILSNLCLKNYFDFVLTSYEFGFTKPDKRIFHEAINYCNEITKPSESLHIGDDLEKDYEGARRAGWHGVLISENKLIPPAKEHVFENLDLLNLAITQNRLKLN